MKREKVFKHFLPVSNCRCWDCCREVLNRALGLYAWQPRLDIAAYLKRLATWRDLQPGETWHSVKLTRAVYRRLGLSAATLVSFFSSSTRIKIEPASAVMMAHVRKSIGAV